MFTFVAENIDNFESHLSNPITAPEFLDSVSSLSNNKAASFDQITNEILKSAKLIIAGPTHKLFNAILENSIYPSQWKMDILSPIHKAGDKGDPNNYRGVTVSSCFGKLFNKILQKRLEKWCEEKNLISFGSVPE